MYAKVLWYKEFVWIKGAERGNNIEKRHTITDDILYLPLYMIMFLKNEWKLGKIEFQLHI